MKNEETNHAISNAKGWSETIAEQVAALEMDWDRYEELKDDMEGLTSREDAETANLAEEWDEYIELKETAGEYESQDDVREQIEQSILDIQVRSDWYTPGSEPDKPSEFMILLSTGGPALRIIGELDQYGQPDRCWMEYQDWGTPWTEYFDNKRSTLLSWCQVFYFGE